MERTTNRKLATGPTIEIGVFHAKPQSGASFSLVYIPKWQPQSCRRVNDRSHVRERHRALRFRSWRPLQVFGLRPFTPLLFALEAPKSVRWLYLSTDFWLFVIRDSSHKANQRPNRPNQEDVLISSRTVTETRSEHTTCFSPGLCSSSLAATLRRETFRPASRF